MSLRTHIITTSAVKVIRLGSGFICSLVLARWLKPEGLGLYTAFMVVPMIMMSLGELGIRQSTAYVTGKQLVDERRVAGALTSLWLLGSLVLPSLLLVCYLVQGMHDHGSIYLVVGMAIAPGGLLTRYANGIALGKQWIQRINIGETLLLTSRPILLAVLLVGLHSGVIGALVVELITGLGPGLLMLYWLRRDLKIRLVPVWDRSLIHLLLARGVRFAIALFVLLLNYRVNILILQHFVSKADLGQFSLGVRMAELLWLIPGAIGMVLFSHSAGASDGRAFSARCAQVMRLALVSCSLGAGILAWIAPHFVRIVFGPEYLPSVPVMRLMLPGCVAAVIYKILHADLAGKGRPLAGIWAFIAALFTNVVLNLVLVPSQGVIGSAIASSIGYLVGAALFCVLYSRATGLPLARLCYGKEDWMFIVASVRRIIEGKGLKA